MASILDRLRQSNPNLTPDDALRALGISSSSQQQTDPMMSMPPVGVSTLKLSSQPGDSFNPDDYTNLSGQSLDQPAVPVVAQTNPVQKPRDFNAEEKPALDKINEDVMREDKDKEDQQKADEDVAIERLNDISDDKGTPSEATRDNLLAAQKKANDADDAAMWSKLGAQIGGALAHASPDVIKNNMDMADMIAKRGHRDQAQLMERIALEKQDPNSTYSIAARDFLKNKFNVDLPEGLSAEALDKTFMAPALKSFEADQQRQAKMEQIQEQLASREAIAEQNRLAREESNRQANMMANLKQQELNAYRENMLKDRNDRHYSDQLESMKKSAIQGGGVAGNQIRNKIQFADNLFGTVGADPNMSEHDIEKINPKQFNNIPRTMVMETAVELNRLLTSSGTAAQGTLNKLVPNNILLDKTKLQDYVTNKMNPADQGEFVKQALKTAARIKNIGKQQNKDLMSKYISGTERIKKYAPDDYNRALTELGLDPSDFEGSKKPSTGTSSKIMDKIPNSEDLTQKLNSVDSMSDEEADAMLKQIRSGK